MTAIAAITDGKKTWMGADSCGSNGWLSRWDIREPKIFRNGPFLIGVAGSCRVSQLVQYSLSLPDDPRDDPRKFMVAQFVPNIRELLGTGAAKKSLNGIDEVNSLLMVAFRCHIFVMHSDFDIMERRESFDAIGSGQDFCLGSLHTTQTMKMPPDKRITAALECAAAFNAGVRGPFQIEVHE